MNALGVALAVIVGLLIAAALAQALATRRDRQRFPAPGRLVDVGGYRLHLNVMGDDKGEPTVILDAGMVSFSSNWAWVQPEVAKVTRVVAYDRAGLGWSDAAPKPRDAGQSAKDLHMALHNANIPGPYVLAGHSYGGMVVRAFAVLYSDEVAGMVLVDGSHPDQWVRFGVPSKTVGIGTTVSSYVARFGLFRLLNGEYKLLANGLPPQQYAELMALTPTPRALLTVGSQAMVWDDVSRPLVNNGGTLGDIPLVVLSVTEQPRMSDKLTALQAELPALSSDSQHITVQGAYHEGLVSQPQYASIVTDAILRVVKAVRLGKPLAQAKAQAQADVSL
jgi:pimeloyl-ACP methyl ester carboxylesterase